MKETKTSVGQSIIDAYIMPAPMLEKLGEFSNQAKRLDGLFETNRKVLETADLNGRKMLVTPQVQIPVHGGGSYTASFFRPDTVKKGEQNVINCWIEPSDELTFDQVRKFYLYVDSGNAERLPDTDQAGYADFSDVTLLNAAIKNVEAVLDPKMRKYLENDKEFKRKCKKVSLWSGGLALTTATLFGAIAGCGALSAAQDRADRATKAKAQARIAQFDNSGKNLKGAGIPLGTFVVKDLSPKQFRQIPQRHKGDDFTDPRRFTIQEQSCKSFDTQVQPGDKIEIVTSSTDQIQNQSIIAGADELNELTVCAIDVYPGQHTDWTLAMQVRRDGTPASPGFDGPFAPVAALKVEDASNQLFDQIPGYQIGDSLDHPRRFKLDDSTCKTFGTPIGPEGNVVINTSANDDIQYRNLVTGRNRLGQLVVCDADVYPNNHDSWSLAVQIEK